MRSKNRIHCGIRMWILAGSFLCLLPSVSGYALSARGAVDGDTIVLEGGDRVRLIGIDTPELDDKYGRNAKTASFEGLKKSTVDQYAVEAKIAADKWLQGQDLLIQYDPANDKRGHRDDYGRLLAYVCRVSDGHCLAEDLLAGGYGVVYRRFRFDRKADFLKLEKQARSEGEGMWKRHSARSAGSRPDLTTTVAKNKKKKV